MTYIDVDRLIETILEGDRELFQELVAHELIPGRGSGLSQVDAEMARLVRTLVRDLEVNWPGVEIIIRLRQELLDTRSRFAELCRLLAEYERRR